MCAGEEGGGEELGSLHADALRALHGADAAHHGCGCRRCAQGRPDPHHYQGMYRLVTNMHFVMCAEDFHFYTLISLARHDVLINLWCILKENDVITLIYARELRRNAVHVSGHLGHPRGEAALLGGRLPQVQLVVRQAGPPDAAGAEHCQTVPQPLAGPALPTQKGQSPLEFLPTALA